MDCRLCGASAADFLAGDAVYAECPECGYVGIEQGRIPTPEAEERRYRLHRNSYEDERYTSWIAEYLDAVAEYLPPGATVLDFGSGPQPVPAMLLRERGCAVSVYDPYFAPGDAWRNARWDAILVHEVAEHLADPRAVFTELAALLSPGGALCVRTRFPPEGREAFSRWRYRMDETHVGFFAARSLERLGSRLGLRTALLEDPDRAVLVRRT
ncbi:MAG: 2-polyprenyl-3-methyl-5-hydroxy-6-metoxy-1,4-benzoquinol methylase [Spirochaetae bacterium HGW-Spirochaetae-3]|jgi:SAM-dependent methyltransferase|nr:MAG: 2-polyprenyl-3-methyl-5-hydroxy-6-metoxy-1,4-benzoquinol methylase [Spirochaetae bacterium HGW-Spirochaetae-3]